MIYLLFDIRMDKSKDRLKKYLAILLDMAEFTDRYIDSVNTSERMIV